MDRSKMFDDFQEYAQVLLASRIFHEYLMTVNALTAARKLENGEKPSVFPLTNVEPEYFCESWIKEYVVGGTEEWRENVFKYFIKLVVNYFSALNRDK